MPSPEEEQQPEARSAAQPATPEESLPGSPDAHASDRPTADAGAGRATDDAPDALSVEHHPAQTPERGSQDADPPQPANAPDAEGGERSGEAGEGPSAADRDLFGRPPKGRRDWSHRRGEPRLLMVLWMLWLMVAVVGVFGSAVEAALMTTPAVFREAARMLVLLVVAALCVLWPMTRLSQVAPERPARALLTDAVWLISPAVIVVLPLRVLAGWPMDVIFALLATIVLWSLLLGGVLTLALRRLAGTQRREGLRAAWTACVALLVIGGPVAASLTSGFAAAPASTLPITVTPGWMSSPLTAVLEITRSRAAAGAPALVTALHWVWLGATAALCVAVWLAVVADALVGPARVERAAVEA